jgi:colanic acid/amylovoran biosynthesis glycosyltransferase
MMVGRDGKRESGAGEGDPVLALVSPSFSQVSETFVADHARTLAPGRTVLVCQDSRGAEAFGCPVLSHFDSDATTFGGRERLRVEFVRRLRRRKGAGPWLSRADRRRLAAFLRDQGVTVVLAEFGYMGVMVMEPCAELGLPLHVYFRGHDATRHLVHRAFLRSYGRLFAQAESVICVSRHLADRLVPLGCPEDRLHVVPSGVDPALFMPGHPERGRILATGRLVPKKAPQLTIEAFARIAARFPEARLDMVGDGPLREECARLVAGYGLEGRVSLHGACSHDRVAAMMARAAIFAQHSVTPPDHSIEGFPTAIAEAMASALPVVSTRHSGIPEHVREGETGLLVEEGDVAGMAEAMARLLADPALARDMGARARAHALVHLDRRQSRARVRSILGLPPVEGEEAGGDRAVRPARGSARPEPAL